jgi:ribosomal protein L11 methyltransferase
MPSPPIDEPGNEPDAAWVLELAVADEIVVPDGCGVGRAAFIEWLWGTLGDHGLEGVFEGAVDVAAAAAAGLIEGPRVLDAAAAPADRDWVAGLRHGACACWFADEASTRRAAAVVAGVAGCEVVGLGRQPTGGAAAAWRDAFGPIAVPGFGMVLPAWHEGTAAASASGCTMFIEPGAGFGTGLHETTQLCLAAIAAWAAGGGQLEEVLDFGSGSGILGIAAAVCGASCVTAVEIDTRVHHAILANAARNGVAERIAVMADWPGDSRPCDLVVANIVADVLVEHADRLAAAVRRGPAGELAGCLVLSGLLETDVERVAAACAGRLGAAVETRRGDWRCLVFTAAAGASACR